MKEHRNNWIVFSSAGFQIAAALLVFGWIGHFCDNYFNSLSPFGLILGLIFGVFISLYHIWKMINPNK